MLSCEKKKEGDWRGKWLTRNSVVLGTRAKSVIPRNFSSIAKPSSTTSTVSTRISAMMAYRTVAPMRMTALFIRLQFGASWPPPPPPWLAPP